MKVFTAAVTACALAGAGLMLAAVPATSALASTGTTVGQTGTPISTVRFTGGAEDIQADAAMPAGGLVTSFQTQSSSCSAGQGVYDFQCCGPWAAISIKSWAAPAIRPIRATASSTPTRSASPSRPET